MPPPVRNHQEDDAPERAGRHLTEAEFNSLVEDWEARREHELRYGPLGEVWRHINEVLGLGFEGFDEAGPMAEDPDDADLVSTNDDELTEADEEQANGEDRRDGEHDEAAAPPDDSGGAGSQAGKPPGGPGNTSPPRRSERNHRPRRVSENPIKLENKLAGLVEGPL